MVDIYLRKLLWVYCPGYAEVKGNDRQIYWRPKQPPSCCDTEAGVIVDDNSHILGNIMSFFHLVDDFAYLNQIESMA